MTTVAKKRISDPVFDDALGALHYRGALTIPINPVPASRPRVSKWGTYYGKTYSKWREAAEESIPEGTLHLEGRIAVSIDHVIKRPAKPSKTWPRGDVDNFDKAALDAITKAGGYWDDDVQVVISASRKRYALSSEEPRTEIRFYELS